MGISTGPDSFIQDLYWRAQFTDTLKGIFRVHYLMKGERYLTTVFTSQGTGSAVTPTGTVWHDLSLQTDLEWSFNRDFSAFLHTSFIRFWNLHHVEGNDGFDIQAGIGITYKVF